jgi:hypothetical protein
MKTLSVAIIFFITAAFVSQGCKDLGSTDTGTDPSFEKKPEVPGMLYDVAGIAGSYGNSGNGGPATSARLYCRSICMSMM